MADFVAVIRRAVDGLTDNNPEMRVKVYEKARSAVVRQLENMNPRPPEAMFKRQLDKLDDAIRQVEEEHREAVPADVTLAEPAQAEAQPAEAAPIEVAQPVAEHVAHAAPEAHVEAAPTDVVAAAEEHAVVPVEHVAEPVHHEVVEEAPRYQPAVDEEPVQYGSDHRDTAKEPSHVEVAHTEPVVYHDGAHAAHVEPEQVKVPDTRIHAEPVVHRAEPTVADHVEHDIQHQPIAASHVVEEDDDPLLAHFIQPREPAIRHASNRVMEQPHVETEGEFPGAEPEVASPKAAEETHVARPAAAMPDWGVDIDREPETVVDPPANAEAPMPRAALTETDVATGFSDFINNEFATPAVKPPPARKEQEGDFSWDAPFDDLPDLPKPVAFEQALHARQEEMAKAPATNADRQRDARSELEDLIGYKSPETENGEQLSPEVSRAMSKLEGKSFKVTRKSKQKFNPIPIAFGVAAALVVAGGSYAGYVYREDVTKLVANYMPADKTPGKSETRDIPKPADQSKSVTVDGDQETASKAADEAKPTEVASLDNNIAPSKFTQRLLENGTETETDAAKVPIDQSLTEGKTIAGQTVAAETEVASTDTKTNTTTTTQPAAETEGLAVTQKMILYEERLGDSPVAVQGKVTWKLTNDTTNASGKDQPMVEATVEVPERKIKAVVSFKRNADPSLPASHIIEVVFDLPQDFPEGNVESVQRVAFKQTEQDRGNSLIAVPAKITDDFHMIALNDDADARKVNTELMKTRSWIDIPVVYRNNRRALLTFEKGSTGTEAFDKALAEWAALGPTANN
jgi:hypothetical protein